MGNPKITKTTGRELASLAMPSHTDFVNNLAVPNTASNAMQNYTEEYSYDKLGNINQMRSVGNWNRDYYYNTADNYLLGHTNGVTVYNYDSHGNCTKMPHLPELAWDYKDQLKEVTLNASKHKAYYTYDASGERVRKVVYKGSIVEERLYIGGFEIYRKTISGTLDYERETLKITEGRNTIAQLETKTIENGNTISSPTTNQRFQYSNHLGRACLELDNSANIISYEEYHPFGTTSYRSGSSETEVSLKRYKYVGKERDEETGLYYYGARYYAGWIARFVSVDPLQFEYPYYTPYQYAGNKPITYIDLDGMEEKKPTPFTQITSVDQDGKLTFSFYTNAYTFENRNLISNRMIRDELALPTLDPSTIEKFQRYCNLEKSSSGLVDNSFVGVSPVGSGLIVIADMYFKIKKLNTQIDIINFNEKKEIAKSKQESVKQSIKTGIWIYKSLDIALETGVYSNTNIKDMSKEFKADVVNYALLKLAGYNSLIEKQRYLAKPEDMLPAEYRTFLSETISKFQNDIEKDKGNSKPKIKVFIIGDTQLNSVLIPESKRKYENQP